eukprot:m.178873 g.178873  ORF g.178873 m.178873 type:complete len:58 (-) comp31953_c2_seq24:1991-2164(-)
MYTFEFVRYSLKRKNTTCTCTTHQLQLTKSPTNFLKIYIKILSQTKVLREMWASINL